MREGFQKNTVSYHGVFLKKILIKNDCFLGDLLHHLTCLVGRACCACQLHFGCFNFHPLCRFQRHLPRQGGEIAFGKNCPPDSFYTS